MSEQIKWGNFCDSVQAWTNEGKRRARIVCQMKNYMLKYIDGRSKNNTGRNRRKKEWGKKNNATDEGEKKKKEDEKRREEERNNTYNLIT